MTARSASTIAPHLTQTSPLSAAGALTLLLAARALARAAFVALGLGAFAGSLAIVVGMGVATLLLARTGESWRSIGLGWPVRYGPTLAWGLGAAVVILFLLPLVLRPIALAMSWPPQHTERLGDLRDTWRYLLFLIPIGWGTAAFGEEMLYRGFIYTRLVLLFRESRVGRMVAGVGQAALFGAVHLYLGPRGALNAFAIGLLSSAVYELSGRDLWPVIIAHGLTDTVGLTALHFGLVDS